MENKPKSTFKEIFTKSLKKTKNVLKVLLKPLKSISLIIFGILIGSVYPCARSPCNVDASSFESDAFALVPSARLSLTYNNTNYPLLEVPTMLLPLEFSIVDYIPTSAIKMYKLPFGSMSPDYHFVNMSGYYESTNFSYIYGTSSLNTIRVLDNEYNKFETFANILFVLKIPLGLSLAGEIPNRVDVFGSNFGYMIESSTVVEISSSSSLRYSYMYNDELKFELSISFKDDLYSFYKTSPVSYAFTMLNPQFLPSTETAYKMGFSEGYYQGQLSVADYGSPFDVIVDSVNSFLSIEILPNVPIRLLTYIGFGLILFGFLIKIFLGG